MKPILRETAAAYVAPKVFRAFRWQWILYGVAAYYGLRYLNKRGIFPKQTGAAVDLMDRGIDMAKESIGLEPARSTQPPKVSTDLQPGTIH